MMNKRNYFKHVRWYMLSSHVKRNTTYNLCIIKDRDKMIAYINILYYFIINCIGGDKKSFNLNTIKSHYKS